MRFLLGLTALLAACTTTAGDLRNHPPKEVFQTDKAPDLVAGCLAEHIVHVGAPTVVNSASGVQVFFTQMAATTAFISIDHTGRVEVRTVNGFIPYRDAIQTCI